jgi:hypothetical protein
MKAGDNKYHQPFFNLKEIYGRVQIHCAKVKRKTIAITRFRYPFPLANG